MRRAPRRSSAGHRAAAGLTMEPVAHPGVPRGPDRVGRRPARARRPAAAAADRRAARVPADHAAPLRRDRPAGAVRHRQPEADVLDAGGAGGRRAAAAEGAAPEHEPAPRRRGPAGRLLARRRAGARDRRRARRPGRGVLDRAEHVQRQHVARSVRWPTSGRPVRGRDEMAAAAPDRDRGLRRGLPRSCSTWRFARPGPPARPPASGASTREDPAATAQSTSGTLLNLLRDAENFRIEYDQQLDLPRRPPEADGRSRLRAEPRRAGLHGEGPGSRGRRGPGRHPMEGAVRTRRRATAWWRRPRRPPTARAKASSGRPARRRSRRARMSGIVGGHDLRQGPRRPSRCSTRR